MGRLRQVKEASDRHRGRGFKRYYQPMIRATIAAGLLAGLLAMPALARDALLGLPPPADTGKPMLPAPRWQAPAANEPANCLPPLPCGSRLMGTVRKNGAVELQMPALRW